MTGHEIGVLKGYMQDMVEQARQETVVLRTAGYREQPYTPEQALMDLLAILDDRMESEGLQVGRPEAFRVEMGDICRRSREYVREATWMAGNMADQKPGKPEIRGIAFKALIDYIDRETG